MAFKEVDMITEKQKKARIRNFAIFRTRGISTSLQDVFLTAPPKVAKLLEEAKNKVDEALKLWSK